MNATLPSDAMPAASAQTVLHDLQAGLEAHRHGDLNTAERHYRAVLQAAPDTLDAYNLLGRLLAQSRRYPLYSIGDSAQGVEYLEAAMENCPTFGENYLALAEALIDSGDYERARTLLNQMVAMPGPPDHSADHEHWLARASDLLNDLPGL